jgi:hypothetical protein
MVDQTNRMAVEYQKIHLAAIMQYGIPFLEIETPRSTEMGDQSYF